MSEHPTQPTRIGGGYQVDEIVPDLPPAAPGLSLTEQLAAAVRTEVESEPITLLVETRPGMSVTYSTELDDELRKRVLAKFTKERRGKSPEVDEIGFACAVLALQCRSINMHGQPVPATDGGNLTFALKQLWDMVGGIDTASTVRRLYGKDPHVMAALEAVLEECGYGDEAKREDPTTAS